MVGVGLGGEGMEERLREAALEYIRRQEREAHPLGEFDHAGRWYPVEEERRPCCGRVRSPSRAYPYSLLLHCRTIGHVAALYGVGEEELRRAVRKMRPPKRLKGEFYKLVAVDGSGRLLSIYDGKTEYKLGEELTQAARREHGGGYYVHRTPEEAHAASFPSDSYYLRVRPKAVALLKVKAEGQYVRYDGGKLAFSRITPLEVVRVYEPEEVPAFRRAQERGWG